MVGYAKTAELVDRLSNLAGPEAFVKLQEGYLRDLRELPALPDMSDPNYTTEFTFKCLDATDLSLAFLGKLIEPETSDTGQPGRFPQPLVASVYRIITEIVRIMLGELRVDWTEEGASLRSSLQAYQDLAGKLVKACSKTPS